MSPHAGQWILIDMLSEDQLGLLSIGSTGFSGSSLRKGLDAVGRELLIDRIRTSQAQGQGADEIVEHRGVRWRVRVDLIHSPVNNVSIAAHAIFIHESIPLPAMPVVGAIEWVVKDSGTHISTFWCDNMFTLYQIERGDATSATGDMNQWVNSLIAPEDRARMKVVIDGGLAAPDGKRHSVTYRIITGQGGSKHLEAYGRVYDAGDGTKRLRSITREVSRLTPFTPPTNVDMTSGGLLHAAFELSGDRVLLAVDMSWFQVFMTSPSWAASGLVKPNYGYLPDVIHPDDIGLFSELCKIAQTTEPPRVIRFLHEDGQYRHFEVLASDGHLDYSANNRYVIASLEAQSCPVG